MGFSCMSKFQINVSVTIFFVLSTVQNSLNGSSSFNGQKDIHKKLLRCTLFLADFKDVYSFKDLKNDRKSDTEVWVKPIETDVLSLTSDWSEFYLYYSSVNTCQKYLQFCKLKVQVDV